MDQLTTGGSGAHAPAQARAHPAAGWPNPAVHRAAASPIAAHAGDSAPEREDTRLWAQPAPSRASPQEVLVPPAAMAEAAVQQDPLVPRRPLGEPLGVAGVVLGVGVLVWIAVVRFTPPVSTGPGVPPVPAESGPSKANVGTAALAPRHEPGAVSGESGAAPERALRSRGRGSQVRDRDRARGAEEAKPRAPSAAGAGHAGRDVQPVVAGGTSRTAAAPQSPPSRVVATTAPPATFRAPAAPALASATSAAAAGIAPGAAHPGEPESCSAAFAAGSWAIALVRCQGEAQAGSGDASRMMAVLYDQGLGVGADRARALMWLRRAALLGQRGAEEQLARAYETGAGISRDVSEAVAWYGKAAAQGSGSAANHLGWMYGNARGVGQDDEQAVRWFRRGAELGDAQAEYNLGFMYASGRGVPRDEKAAVEWFSRAARAGYAPAVSELQRRGVAP